MENIFKGTTINRDCSGFKCLLESKSIFIKLNDILPTINPIFGRGNTCIISKGNSHYLLNIRNVNYRIDENGWWHLANEDGSLDTINEMVVFDKEFKIVFHKIFTPSSQKAKFRGLEDIRIIEISNSCYFYTASYQTPDLRIQISSDFYFPDANELGIRIIPSPLDSKVEKNWAMFIYNNSLKYVYSWNPFLVGEVALDGKFNFILKHEYDIGLLKFIKNSSNGIWVDNELWFLVHTHCDNNSFRQYYHCFIVMNNMKIKKISKCFTFEKKKIEYCIGVVIEKNDIIFTYTVFDQDPRLIKVPRKIIENMMISV